MLLELTSGYTGHRIAIDPAIVGEVKDLAAELGSRTGRTLLVHRSNRRVHWRVHEPYLEVVAAIAAAGVPVAPVTKA